jgi:hypothetical protein
MDGRDGKNFFQKTLVKNFTLMQVFCAFDPKEGRFDGLCPRKLLGF